MVRITIAIFQQKSAISSPRIAFQFGEFGLGFFPVCAICVVFRLTERPMHHPLRRNRRQMIRLMRRTRCRLSATFRPGEMMHDDRAGAIDTGVPFGRRVAVVVILRVSLTACCPHSRRASWAANPVHASFRTT